MRDDLRAILIKVRSDAEIAVRTLKVGRAIEESAPESISGAFDQMKKLKGELRSPSWQYLDRTAVAIIRIESAWNMMYHASSISELGSDGKSSESARRIQTAQENLFTEAVTDGVVAVNRLLSTIGRIDGGNVFSYLAHRI